MAKKRGKVPLATVFGLALTGKRVYDEYKAIQASAPNLTGAHMTKVLTGYVTPELSAAGGGEVGMNTGELIATWAPAVGGSLISKYVGGKDGLNINSKIQAIPFVKI